MTDIHHKQRELLQPSDALISDIADVDGDILVLGAGGKIGPSIAKLAMQAIKAAGVNKKVIGVSRFTEPGLQDELNEEGIETIVADLLKEKQLQALPEVKNVLYLAGTKFGTTGQEAFTWAMNSYLPGRVAEKYKNSRIVAYSTGNVYPFTPVADGGATEEYPPEPIGEYGQSCLGRERIFQHFSLQYNIPLVIFRLNYANDLRYGVLTEVAKAVKANKPIDLSVGHVNVIWQGDSNEWAIRSFKHCDVPSKLLNVTGPETVSVRWLAHQFGNIFKKEPQFTGQEQPTALLSNAGEAFRLFGYPQVALKQMIELTSEWLNSGGELLNKPTHFQERTGKF